MSNLVSAMVAGDSVIIYAQASAGLVRYTPDILWPFFSVWLMKDTPKLARKGKIWGVIRECKSDRSFVIVIVVLCVLSYHI